MKTTDLVTLFGKLEVVMRCVIAELRQGFIVIRDPADTDGEFFIGPNGDTFLSMVLRCRFQPDELFGATQFDGCETVALCIRCGDALRIYFRGDSQWEPQGELALWDERKRVLRIELVDRTVNEEWNFAGIGMRIVYETHAGKEYAIVYDNSLRRICEESD